MVTDPASLRPNEEGPVDDRTGYALDRSVLANERTYAAWIRTGLTALAAGVAIEKFMVDAMPGWTIRSIAIILIVYSVIAFVIAAWRYGHLGLKLVHVDVKSIPSIVTTGTSVLLIVCSLLALAGLWLIDPGWGNYPMPPWDEFVKFPVSLLLIANPIGARIRPMSRVAIAVEFVSGGACGAVSRVGAERLGRGGRA